MTKSTPLPAIGTALQGGYYAGILQIAGERFALIVAPKAQGEFDPAVWQAKSTDIAGATSFCDGAANTAAMVAGECPHATAAANLSIGGFTDWYLPSRDELEILYRAFKPGTETNFVYRHGENPSSVPPSYPYTAASPSQTPALAFQQDGAEAFDDTWYWSSTQYSRTSAWGQNFGDGSQILSAKSYEGRARAVRRFIA